MLWKGYVKQFKDLKCSNTLRYFLKTFSTYPNGAIFSAAYQSGGEQCTLSWRSTLFTWALSRGLCNSSTVPLQLSKAHRQLSVKLSGASVPISKYTRSFSECLLTQTWARTTHARSRDRLVLSSRQQTLPELLFCPHSSPTLTPTLPIIYVLYDISEEDRTIQLDFSRFTLSANPY